MAVQFTEDQSKAINTLDKSILVAAAAGSGKTAVLIQRIINIILQDKADVDEMLIVTFTNAAAAEMRVKISREIKKRMQEDGADRAKLSAQLDKLYRAYISTFNSFAIRIIREFFYEVDIDPNFKVCDDVTSTMLKNEAVDDLFELGFEQDDFIDEGSFKEFLRLYSSDRREDAIKEEIISAYDKLRTMPDYFQWAFEKAELLNLDEDEIGTSELATSIKESFVRMVASYMKDYEAAKSLFTRANMYEKFMAAFEVEEQTLNSLAEIMDETGFSKEFCDAAATMTYGRMPRASKDEKDAYEAVKEDIMALRKRYKKTYDDWYRRMIQPGFAKRVEELNGSYKYTRYFLKLLMGFEARYAALKKVQGVMDFSDMEHTAAEILKNEDIAKTLRKRFKFIFVDEYQDTNNIQEALIARISRPDNVFKVGDVKQSIYRFRQAEPAIFLHTYTDYKSDDNSDAVAIDLNKNFRCNSKSVDYINLIFADTMEGYDDAAKLNVGVTSCPDEYDFFPEVHMLIKDGAESESEDEDDVCDEDVVEGELRELSKNEAEAKYVSERIAELIGQDFFDTVENRVRKVEPRDVVILLRSMKNRGNHYANALRNLEIQSHVEEDSDYFDTVEIQVAVSIFMTIDNFKRDVPLIATLHSEVFGFDAETLAKIKIAHKGYLASLGGEKRYDVPYWEALGWYASDGDNETIKEKLKAALSKITEWKKLSQMMPLPDFVWKVLTDSNYYMYAGAMYGGSRRQANLRTLVNKANEFTQNTIASLGDFIRYLEVLKAKKVKNGQASMVSKDDNVVRITTIHKSKGLEYPFVIVAGAGNRQNRDTNSKGFKFDTSIGVGLTYVSPDKTYWRSTLLQAAIFDKNRSEEDKEELRVFYVALTRVRNKLMIVGTVNTDCVDQIKSGVKGSGTYFGSIGKRITSPLNRFFKRELESFAPWDIRTRAKDVIETCTSDAAANEVEANKALYDEVERKLGYSYPQDKLLSKAKYSVSELRKEIVEARDVPMKEEGTSDEEVVAIVRNSNTKKKRASSADIGIAYHRIMEYIDFGKVSSDGNVDLSCIEASAEELVKKGAIDEDAYKSLDLNRIASFFESDLGKRCIKASLEGSLRKEKPFTVVMDREGQDVLVQGVIDCCFDEDGEMVLIDYKSSFIHKNKPYEAEIDRIRHEYEPQIAIYGKALKEGAGKPLKEAYLYLFLYDEAIRMETV